MNDRLQGPMPVSFKPAFPVCRAPQEKMVLMVIADCLGTRYVKALKLSLVRSEFRIYFMPDII